MSGKLAECPTGSWRTTPPRRHRRHHACCRAEAARCAFRTTDGTLSPTVSLEGRAKDYNASPTLPGHSTNQSGAVVFSWDAFRGGQDSWRRVEMSERYIEATQRHARLQREAFSSVDKAWAAQRSHAARGLRRSSMIDSIVGHLRLH